MALSYLNSDLWVCWPSGRAGPHSHQVTPPGVKELSHLEPGSLYIAPLALGTFRFVSLVPAPEPRLGNEIFREAVEQAW